MSKALRKGYPADIAGRDAHYIKKSMFNLEGIVINI